MLLPVPAAADWVVIAAAARPPGPGSLNAPDGIALKPFPEGAPHPEAGPTVPPAVADTDPPGVGCAPVPAGPGEGFCIEARNACHAACTLLGLARPPMPAISAGTITTFDPGATGAPPGGEAKSPTPAPKPRP